ncbi:MAG: DUF1847 domain-containing protein [Oscillospiraceae bacterium]
MYTCAHCTILACREEHPEKLPKNCPMRNSGLMDTALATYALPENRDFYITASELEALGYCQWPRIKETIVLCQKMGYTRIGLAFCFGLRKEAKIVDELFRRAGLEVVSVICKTGGADKESVGISPDSKLNPGSFEAMCNPIAQAKLLNEQKTQFNVALGLCVGHDSMFYKYSDALVTTLVAKDRVTGHNPAAAIYCADGYFKKRIL